MERPRPEERARRAAFLAELPPKMRRKVVDNPALIGSSRPEHWTPNTGTLTWDDLGVDAPTNKQLDRQGNALRGKARR